MIQLRDYQKKGKSMLYESIRNGARKICWVFPTGAGKSTIASSVVKDAILKKRKVLFVVHSKELVLQFKDRLKTQFGVSSGVIMAGHKSEPYDVQVASLQTLVRRPMPEAHIVIIDECHRAKSASYLKIVEHYSDRIIIGLTATPFRMDGKPLGDIFEEIVHPIKIQELVARGKLVPTEAHVPKDEVDMSNVKTIAGDFAKDEMYARFNDKRILNGIVKNYKSIANGKKAIVFCCNVAHSKQIKESFEMEGIKCGQVDGTTSKVQREVNVEMFRVGQIKVLCNVGVYCEGFDIPDCEVVILGRATKSLGLYVQMVGRGLRPAEGKKKCIVIDHGGNVLRHGFVEDYDSIEFDLNEKRKSKVMTPRKCKNCGVGAMRRINAMMVCSCCSYSVDVSREDKVKFSDGEVEFEILQRDKARLTSIATKSARELKLGELRIYQRIKGYQFGWCKHQAQKMGLFKPLSNNEFAEFAYELKIAEDNLSLIHI